MIRKRRLLKYFCYAFVSYLIIRYFILVFGYWFQSKRNYVQFCGGNFIGYENKFAKLVNSVIDPTKGSGKVGGENISEVLNQSESSEFFEFSYGYFEFQCNETVRYNFRPDVHLSKWISVLRATEGLPPHSRTINGWTIAVTRFEYANLYHTLTDYYNTFRLMKMFDISLSNFNVLFIDAHPAGILDKTWSVLFGNVIRVGVFKESVRFENFLWGISGYDSDMNNHYRHELPFIEDFKHFFLRRHQIMEEKTLNCNQLNILIIFRRDYVAHPRNPTGKVSRKIKNENELVDTIASLLPGHYVRGLQFESLSMHEQLKLISSTDILIGMHGAGLTHAMFLPRHAGIVELFPYYWYGKHFRAIARWRKLKYLAWQNMDMDKELPHDYTVVDVNVIGKKVLRMKDSICS